MSVWSWKRSGWINSTLATSLTIAVITGICSSGIRTGFQVVTTTFNFYGGLHPEIGIFNMLLYIAALFGFISVSLRYSYVVDQTQVIPTAVEYLNKISIVTGFLSFFGLILVASFPVSYGEKESTYQSTGAYIFIGVGFIFTIFQTVITYASFRFSPVFFIRLCLVLILMSTFISSLVLIERNKDVNVFFNSTVLHSNETEVVIKVNKEQLVACCLEWACVVVYALYFMSFIQEFRNVSAYVILRPFIVPATTEFRTSSLTINERV